MCFWNAASLYYLGCFHHYTCTVFIYLIQRPVIHRRTDKADNFNKRNGSVKLFYISFLTVHLGVDWIEFQCEKQTV